MNIGTRTALACFMAAMLVPGGVAAQPAAATTDAMRIERLDPALDAVIAPGTQIEKVATGFAFAEGPVWHEGRLLFADIPNSRVMAMTRDGKYQTLIENSGGPATAATSSFKGSNGMAVDKAGNVLMTQHAGRRIVRFDRSLTMVPVVERFEGKRFNSPNDLVFAPDGALWFTDPAYGLAGQNDNPAKELTFTGVYRFAGGKLVAVIKDLPTPNGIGFSPDGRTLYVANSAPDMAVWRYDVKRDGSVANGRVLIAWSGKGDVPDGLKVDAAGNIWASGPGGIRIITPAGKVLGQIHLPETAANLGWADGGKTAYITATSSVYRISLSGKGGRMPLYARP